MDYEKAYKEALERARQFSEKPYLEDSKGIVDYIFPELKESEGERIKREISEALQYSVEKGSAIYPSAKTTIEEALAWLEKQGEQKFEQKFFINNKVVHKATGKIWTIHHYLKDTNSYYVEDNDGLLHHYRESELKLVEQKSAEFDDTNAKRMFIKALERVEEQNNKGYKLTDCDKNSWWEDFKAYTSCIVEQKPWSEEDERLRTSCIKHIEEELERIKNDKYGHSEIISDLKESCRERINWLESLKDRVQRKQEWSEEDKAILEKCIGAVKVSCYSYSFKSEAENWLKSLRPQNRWKPSEEQMKVLNEVINFAADHGTMRWNDYIYNVLKGLREQLKKL